MCSVEVATVVVCSMTGPLLLELDTTGAEETMGVDEVAMLVATGAVDTGTLPGAEVEYTGTGVPTALLGTIVAVTGQMVVYSLIVDVMTIGVLDSAGQLVTSGAQLVIVISVVR